MAKKDYEAVLRNPYNDASLNAMGMIKSQEAESVVSRALYGVYCEALVACRDAIRQGASVEDLTETINRLGVSDSRIVE